MKAKKKTEEEANVDKKTKLVKNKKKGVASTTKFGSLGTNVPIKKSKDKVVNKENEKRTKKLKQVLGSPKMAKDNKMKNCGKPDSFEKSINSSQQLKKDLTRKPPLKSSMSSSELLTKLNTTLENKSSNKIENSEANQHKVKKTIKVQEVTLKKSNKNSKVENALSKNKKFGKVHKVKKIKNETKQKNKSKFEKKLQPSLAEAPKFDEENFNAILCDDNIQKSIKALKKLVKKETEEMKNTIFKDYRYIINFGLFKIPSAPKRQVKLKIKHSLVGPDDDVLFIVKDLQRGLKVDYEPTIHHYEDIIREKGIKGIKTVMPYNQLKKEYNSYEMKRKLANLYDYFICDGRIIGHTFGFLGTTFSSKQRCTVFPVRTENINHLKKEIHTALHKTSFKQGSKGDNVSIIVGNHYNSYEEVSENIIEVLKQLKKKLPGGFPNIRNINIKVNIKGTSSVPLYISMGKPPKDTPYVIGMKEQKFNKMKQKAEKILNNFTFTNEGLVQKLPPEEIETRKRKLKEPSEEKIKKNKKSKFEVPKENLVKKTTKVPKENKKRKVQADEVHDISDSDNT